MDPLAAMGMINEFADRHSAQVGDHRRWCCRGEPDQPEGDLKQDDGEDQRRQEFDPQLAPTSDTGAFGLCHGS